MAQEHAVPAAEEEKKHGDELSGSLNKSPKSSTEHSTSNNHAIPPAEDGGHARSVAAHLQEHAHLHDNKNAVQHHVPTGQLREPPQEVSRVGKGHRGE